MGLHMHSTHSSTTSIRRAPMSVFSFHSKDPESDKRDRWGNAEVMRHDFVVRSANQKGFHGVVVLGYLVDMAFYVLDSTGQITQSMSILIQAAINILFITLLLFRMYAMGSHHIRTSLTDRMDTISQVIILGGLVCYVVDWMDDDSHDNNVLTRISLGTRLLRSVPAVSAVEHLLKYYHRNALSMRLSPPAQRVVECIERCKTIVLLPQNRTLTNYYDAHELSWVVRRILSGRMYENDNDESSHLSMEAKELISFTQENKLHDGESVQNFKERRQERDLGRRLKRKLSRANTASNSFAKSLTGGSSAESDGKSAAHKSIEMQSLSHHRSIPGAIRGPRALQASESVNMGKHRKSIPPAAENKRLQIEKAMRNAYKWKFDVFEAARAADGRPAYLVGYFFLQELELISTFGIDNTTAMRFLQAVDEAYLPNPFHNSTHAADVMQSTVVLLRTCGLLEYLTPIELFAAVVGALVHDVGHPGVQNSFLVATGDEKAIRYNDISVLESFHLARSWEIFEDPQTNILAALKPHQWARFREVIYHLIMGTDMAMHKAQADTITLRLLRDDIDLNKASDRLMVLTYVVHSADISNGAKPKEISSKWSDRVMHEFYNQGDIENELGLPISPFCDKAKGEEGVIKCQLGFNKHIIRPHYALLLRLIKNINPSGARAGAKLLAYVDENIAKWNSALVEFERKGSETATASSTDAVTESKAEAGR